MFNRKPKKQSALNVDHRTAMKWFESRKAGYARLTSAVARYVEPDGEFIDVGANIGYFTMMLADRLKFSGSAYLFEPLPHLVKLCNKSFKKKRDYNARVFAFGLSDADAKLDIHVAADGNLGWNTIVSGRASKGMTAVEIEVRAFDQLDLDIHPSLIKVDVEGAEYRVFQGMFESLRNWNPRPAILCEVGWGESHPNWDEELRVFRELENIGYKTLDLDALPLDVSALTKTTDILLLPS